MSQPCCSPATVTLRIDFVFMVLGLGIGGSLCSSGLGQCTKEDLAGSLFHFPNDLIKVNWMRYCSPELP